MNTTKNQPKINGCLCGTHGIEITFSLSDALLCGGQGAQDDNCAQLVKDGDISDQLDEIGADDIRAALKETGGWDDDELADEHDAQNRIRAVWVAACDAREKWEALDEPVRALCQHLDCSPDDVTKNKYDHYGMPVYSAEGGEYAIGTDEEADSAWDQSLNSYLDDCVLPELPESVRNYFDDEKWKRDARYDGRGHSLSPYDGNEEEEEVDGTNYYIYRTN